MCAEGKSGTFITCIFHSATAELKFTPTGVFTLRQTMSAPQLEKDTVFSVLMPKWNHILFSWVWTCGHMVLTHAHILHVDFSHWTLCTLHLLWGNRLWLLPWQSGSHPVVAWFFLGPSAGVNIILLVLEVYLETKQVPLGARSSIESGLSWAPPLPLLEPPPRGIHMGSLLKKCWICSLFCAPVFRLVCFLNWEMWDNLTTGLQVIGSSPCLFLSPSGNVRK